MRNDDKKTDALIKKFSVLFSSTMNQNGTINKVILVGEISNAPYWHKNDNEKPMLCFKIITSESFRQNGKQAEHVEEHAIRVEGSKPDNELKPGQWVQIEGKIKTSHFLDSKAIKHFKAEVIATKLQLLNGA